MAFLNSDLEHRYLSEVRKSEIYLRDFGIYFPKLGLLDQMVVLLQSFEDALLVFILKSPVTLNAG